MFRLIHEESIVGALRATGFVCTPQLSRDTLSTSGEGRWYEIDLPSHPPWEQNLLDDGTHLYWRRRLLLVSCSAGKRQEVGLLPACERYTGIVYRLIAQLRRAGNWPADVLVRIISAEYGLISEDALLPYYDRRITEARALELRLSIGREIDTLLRTKRVQEVFINMGATYRLALSTSQMLQLMEGAGQVYVARGRPGQKRLATKKWLCEYAPRQMSACTNLFTDLLTQRRKSTMGYRELSHLERVQAACEYLSYACWYNVKQYALTYYGPASDSVEIETNRAPDSVDGEQEQVSRVTVRNSLGEELAPDFSLESVAEAITRCFLPEAWERANQEERLACVQRKMTEAWTGLPAIARTYRLALRPTLTHPHLFIPTGTEFYPSSLFPVGRGASRQASGEDLAEKKGSTH